MIFNGNTKIAGVMGWPISHSRSPMLHGYWLREYKINGAYLPFAVASKDLSEALKLLPKLGISGVNLTAPHKEVAFEICDRVDITAKKIGAVNTVVVEKDGSLTGTNTDAFGFLENLKARSSWSVIERPAVVLGAGGAARAVVAALIDAGVSEIRVVNRTFIKAEGLVKNFRIQCVPYKWSEVREAFQGAGLLVNTTTLGMVGQPELQISLDTLPKTAIVNDIVYVPLQTCLLKRAYKRGNAAVDGLGMLLHQARPGFSAWFGKDPTVTKTLREFISVDLNI